MMNSKKRIKGVVLFGVGVAIVTFAFRAFGKYQYIMGQCKGEVDTIDTIISTINEQGWIQIGDIGNSEGCMIIREDRR